MPNYQYKCTDCHEIYTDLQSITDESNTPCPKCLSINVKRLIGGGGGAIFKGSGFYTTDYKKAPPKK